MQIAQYRLHSPWCRQDRKMPCIPPWSDDASRKKHMCQIYQKFHPAIITSFNCFSASSRVSGCIEPCKICTRFCCSMLDTPSWVISLIFCRSKLSKNQPFRRTCIYCELRRATWIGSAHVWKFFWLIGGTWLIEGVLHREPGFSTWKKYILCGGGPTSAWLSLTRRL